VQFPGAPALPAAANPLAADVAALLLRVQQLEATVRDQRRDLDAQPRIPSGTILAWTGPSPAAPVPDGWLPADGRSLDPTNRDFMPLYLVIGDKFGRDPQPNGRIFFRLPKLAGTMLRGATNSEPVCTIGGSDTVTLTAANLPAHTHSGTTDADCTATVPALAAVIHPGSSYTAPCAGVHSHRFTTDGGSGCVAMPFSAVPSHVAVTYLIKL
jgi:microcystin-dependent protein